MSKATPHERGPGWDPSHPAVVRETDASTGRIVSLEHVMHPYPEAAGELWDSGVGTMALFTTATKYVESVAALLGIPKIWLSDLAGSPGPKNHVQLRWHSLGTGDPRDSFLLRRRQESQDVDRSFVLVASLSIRDKVPPADIFLHGEQGLRVAGTLESTSESSKYLVRITDIVTTLPPAPDETILERFVPSIELPVLRAFTLSAFEIAEDAVVADMGVKLARIPSGSAEQWGLELRLDVLRPEPDSDISYRLIARTGVGSRAPGGVEPVARIPLTSDITASLFRQDPITKHGASAYGKFRPNRSSAVLNLAVTTKVQLGPLPQGSTHKRVLLTDPVNDYVRVTNSPLVASESALPPDDPKEVSKKSLKASDVRTDTFAAINAYHHGRDLFQKMTKLGLVPEDFFKFASLPLIVRYRSGIEPGPGRDGRLINAQARWSPAVVSESALVTGTLILLTPDEGAIPIGEGSAKIIGAGDVRVVAGGTVENWEDSVVIVRSVDEAGTVVDRQVNAGLAITVPGGVLVVAMPGQLEVCFAMADLQSSIREAPIGAPLGVACDARWAWHEFSHVLLAAATGELEFRFAHSAGDALGAILFDPESALASDTDFRFISFPWVCWPCRRHDRKVADGWSWSGPLYHRERFFDNGLSLKKAYWSEQMLSTSLFRLYRALGGDSADGLGHPDRPARGVASDYAVMLVMRAIQSMGPASAVPLLTVEKFVIALKEADAATGTFGPAALRRVGGVAQKAIRWAFEQQGLYGGLAPVVDVFIDDGRRGEYTPLSMSGTSWHATGAIQIEDTGGNPIPGDIPTGSGDVNVFVIVENRGSSASSAIDIRVDVARTPAGAIPDWLDAKWKPLSASTIGAPVPAGGKVRVGPVLWKRPAPGNYALFAAATCAEDPASVDAASALPCASVSGPMCFLVAGDNNLGLRLVKAS